MSRQKLISGVAVLFAVVLAMLALDGLLPALSVTPVIALGDVTQNLITVFLGIFIEAAPFLLLGSLASGLIAVFVSADDIAAVFPRSRPAATLAGALIGIVFPVCECGVVPVVRRLTQKGLPISAGIAFLLAAPVVNPVVFASTYAAFGWGPVLWLRVGLTLVVAVGIGLVFTVRTPLLRIMRPRSLGAILGGSGGEPALKTRPALGSRLEAALATASEDFFDVGRYLVIGSVLAATLQTFVPQSALVALGQNQVSSVLALQALAYVLSVCSTVDAFLALSFGASFSTGSVIAFLVFGPMVDIKSTLMYLGLFRRRVVLYIALLAFLMTLLAGVLINLNIAI
jgi:hypothetical protein